MAKLYKQISISCRRKARTWIPIYPKRSTMPPLTSYSRYVDGAIALPPDLGPLDQTFRERLTSLLGKPTPEKRWLAALLAKRIKLFTPEFKSFHFTRNAQQVSEPCASK